LDIDRQLPSVRAIGKPIRVAAVPIRMSQQAAIPAPPPVQAPASGTIRVTRPLKVACAMIACCTITVFAFRSLAGALCLDELLTMTLVQAGSLPKLWSGIVAGIDGNPPFYLTAAWLIVHAMPQVVSPVAVLKLTNRADRGRDVRALSRRPARRIRHGVLDRHVPVRGTERQPPLFRAGIANLCAILSHSSIHPVVSAATGRAPRTSSHWRCSMQG
jgi:hypothetical protein